MTARLLTVLLALSLALGMISCKRSREAGTEKITVWVNPATTTPVLPLYALQDESMVFRSWNTGIAFQSLLLAGDGEIWVGHLEGFARAWQRGAPVRLLAVTGWRKWQILTRRDDIEHFPEDFVADAPLPFAPADGAGRFLLEELLRETGSTLRLQPMDVKPLLLRAANDKLDSAILPEPFATALIQRGLGFRRVTSLEEYYGRCRNTAPEVPWAGIAVHRDWAESHPDVVAALLKALVREGEYLNTISAEATAQYWSSERAAESGISREELIDSLARDPVKVVPAKALLPEIRAFLKTVAPDVPFRDEMVWEE